MISAELSLVGCADKLWCHSQAFAPNGQVQAMSRVGRLGVMAVTDWVAELTAHNVDGQSKK